jgi:hypothetical protein
VILGWDDFLFLVQNQGQPGGTVVVNDVRGENID